MMWVLAAMVLLGVLLIVVAASWMRNLVRLDHELRNRAHHAALLLQRYDLADAATERAD